MVRVARTLTLYENILRFSDGQRINSSRKAGGEGVIRPYIFPPELWFFSKQGIVQRREM